MSCWYHEKKCNQRKINKKYNSKKQKENENKKENFEKILYMISILIFVISFILPVSKYIKMQNVPNNVRIAVQNLIYQ